MTGQIEESEREADERALRRYRDRDPGSDADSAPLNPR